jgi:general secretion pathway protein L
MVSEIQQRLQQLRDRFQYGPAGQFLSWWGSELKQAMPASWQEKLQHALRRVVVQLEDESLIINIDENRRLNCVERLPLSTDTEWQRRQIEDCLETNDLDEATTILAIDIGAVLSKDLMLPTAAESNLAQVLAFEMDRQTPFKASEIYYDWEVVERDLSGQLSLKLYLVPRPAVDGAVRAVTERGLSLGGIDIMDGGRTLGLNLMPPESRSRAVKRKARINYALGLAVGISIAIVMAQSLYLRKHQVRELEEAIAAVQGQAREVMQIKEKIGDSSEAAGFLANRRAESPLAIELLADVTRLLPDNTYLDRLVIGRESVQLQGKSQNAQALIELVNSSEILEGAAFRGSTRLDARTGLEIFEVNANIGEAQAD